MRYQMIVKDCVTLKTVVMVQKIQIFHYKYEFKNFELKSSFKL